MIDVVQLVRDNKAKFEWTEVKSIHNGHTLYIKVFRDAMKFDNIPALTWDFKLVDLDHRLFSWVRLPASAHQLQEIADLLGCMLLTPKVIDLLWLQAELKFDSIVTVDKKIVAISNIHDVHHAIEAQIHKLGGDNGAKLIECVGKYWCLHNNLIGMAKVVGDEAACNYGWFAKKASGPGLTPGTYCWQRPGFRHNKRHWDPSQTIRLMHRMARLITPDGVEKQVDLHDIAADSSLSFLINHTGTLKYLRQKGVTKLDSIVMPEPASKPEPKPTPTPIPEPVTPPVIPTESKPPVLIPEIVITEPKPTETNLQLYTAPKGIWQIILAFLMSILSIFRRK
jgi:hypothetical protein